MFGEISFPSLGIAINPSNIAFHIGPKPIFWYGIIIAFGFLLAVAYGIRRSKAFGLTQDNILDMLFCAVPLAIIGLRVYYCLFSWDMYKDNPISVLYIWEGGLAIYGGIIGSVLGVFLFKKIYKVPAAPMMDIGALGLLIGQSIGRWGNFMNREAFGAETSSFLRMGLKNAAGEVTYYHPTFLYESLWNAAGFVLLHFLSKKRKYDGQIFIAYVGWYGLGRFIIEGLRMDSLYIGTTNLRVSQVLAGLCFLAAILILAYNRVFREYDEDSLYVNRRAKLVAVEQEEAPNNADDAATAADDEVDEDSAEN